MPKAEKGLYEVENERVRKHIAELIRREVSFFNGWAIPDSSARKACEKATEKILKYLARGTHAERS
jgi:hypothetical protein